VKVKFSKIDDDDQENSFDDEVNELKDKDQIIKEFKVDLDLTT
jgi:hypothetical protein